MAGRTQVMTGGSRACVTVAGSTERGNEMAETTQTQEIEAIKFKLTSGPRIASKDIVQLLKDQAAEIDRLRKELRELQAHHNEDCSCPVIF